MRINIFRYFRPKMTNFLSTFFILLFFKNSFFYRLLIAFILANLIAFILANLFPRM